MPSQHAPATKHGTSVLRFIVLVGDERITAYLSEATWHAHHERQPRAAALAEIYRQHGVLIDAIVACKVHAGARSPVVLMARDLQPRELHPADRKREDDGA